MSETTNLALPLIAAAQAQKHVTHNEALLALDALVQLAVLDADLTAPPGSPLDGDRYIVGASPTGAWSGHAGHIAAWQDGAWSFHVPKTGWLAYLVDDEALVVFDGSDWVAVTAGIGGGGDIDELQELNLLGVGTTADSTNPFAAKLNNALWVAKTVAEGGDGHLRYKMSKESAAKTLSLLMQTNFSGRAELGLTGDDDFRLKVSADGSAWKEALQVDRASGVASFPSGAALGHGQCVLVLSGGSLVLRPVNGNRLIIGGVAEKVPSAGVSLAATGLTPSTLYYIYAAMSGGAMVLEASTTSHATDSTTGVEIKSGDASRTLVGMARPVAGPAWVDSETQRFVRSWFHRELVRPTLTCSIASNQTTGSTSYVELDSAARAHFLIWTGELVSYGIAFLVYLAGGAAPNTVFTSIGFDGVAPEFSMFTRCQSLSTGVGSGTSAAKGGLAEGYHYATWLGAANGSGNTAGWQGGGAVLNGGIV